MLRPTFDSNFKTMKKREAISKIMTANVIAVNESDDLNEVVKIFKKHKVRHLPVVIGDNIVGIMSRSDVNRLTYGAIFDGQESVDEAILNMLTIPQVMTSKPRTLDIDATIKEAAEIFANEEYHALPVTENNKLVGIVTTTDIIKYLLEMY